MILQEVAIRLTSESVAKVAASLSYEQLSNLLDEADNLYYNHGTSPLTDAQYDAFSERLATLRGTERDVVGAPVSRNKVQLPVWLGSLDKVKTSSAVSKWAGSSDTFVISDKLDGISGLLLPGKRLYTRGNGDVGENISKVLQYVKVPVLRGKIAVRGELVIRREDAQKLHDVIEYKNLRNLVAGALNSKTPNKDVLPFVRFVAYEAISNIEQEKPSAQFARLKRMGFEVPWHNRVDTLSDIEDTLLARRRASPYDVDGIVVSKDSSYDRASGRNPSYSVAYKNSSADESLVTEVREVAWTVSKHNYLKPTVIFDKVDLAGVTIQRATGFNAKFIVDNGIGPKALVKIVRSGDVIPFITEVVKQATPSLPLQGTFEWTESGVDIVATDSSADLDVARLTFFFERLGAKSVGQKTLEALYSAGYTSVRKLLDAKPEEIARLHGMGDKAAENIVKALETAASGATCVSLMDASSHFGRGIGERRLHGIYDALGSPSLQKLAEMATNPALLFDKVIGIPGMGDVTTRQFVDSLPEFLDFVRSNKLSCKADKVAGSWNVVFTGFRDKELEERVVTAGGRISSTVTADTLYVISLDITEDTTKLKQARAKGITIMSKDSFDQWLRKKKEV